MKYIALAAALTASLGLAACTTESNRGISAAAQTDTMTPQLGPARPIHSGGGANVSVAQQGGTMSIPATGAQTTTIASPATSTAGGTMSDPAVTRPR